MKKRKRVKKSTRKIMIFFLLASSVSVSSFASAAPVNNSGVSDASIVLKAPAKDKEKEKEKQKEKELQEAKERAKNKNGTSMFNSKSGTGRKLLPQTANNQEETQLLVGLGSVLLLAIASMLIIKRKKEKNYEQ